MIELNCTNCNKTLSIDDAFAGGVCRCQHCGTIQTVPAKGQARAATPVGAAGAAAAKPLYKRKARIESALSPFNDGLDEAADQIPSSGLSNSSLVAGVQRKPATGDVPLSSQLPMSGMGQGGNGGLVNPPVEYAARHAANHPAALQTWIGKRKVVVGIAAAVLACGLGAVAWLLLGSDSGESGVTPDNAIVKPTGGPEFAGIGLDGEAIVYILDRSGCSNQTFAEMVRVTSHSVRSLGSTRRFQVLVMGADKIISYPPSGMKNATPSVLEGFTDTFRREFYVGQKNASTVFKRAIETAGAQLVLVSANDEHTALFETLSPVLGQKPRPVLTLYVGPDDSPGLRQLAQATGAEYFKLNLSAVK